MDSLVPTSNLIVTAYYDYSNSLLKSRRYDASLVAAGLVDALSSAELHDSERLLRTFYTEFALMSAVRLFFRPKPSLQREVDRFLAEWSSFHLVGMQIRMGSGGADFRDTHTFLKPEAITTFVSLAEEYRAARGFSSASMKWFISTDSSVVERKLKALYPEQVIVLDSFRRGHSSLVKSNRNGFFRAVMDISVLSRCEYLILTNHSSFGMIARMVSDSPVFTVVPARGY